jgi:hypothetical protein
MPNYNELLDVMKQSAKGVMDDADLADICFGTVASASPLKVKVEQKYEIGKENLVVPQYLTNFTVGVTVSWQTENETYQHSHTVEGTESSQDSHTHKHSISGTKQITINNALKSGDKVILIKQLGGQKYLIIDRVG